MHVIFAQAKPLLLIRDRLLTRRTDSQHVSYNPLWSLLLNLGIVRTVRTARFLYGLDKVIDLGDIRIIFHHGLFVFP